MGEGRGGRGGEGRGAGSAPCAPHARTLTFRRDLEDYDKNRDFVGILAYSAHRHFGVHVLAAESAAIG